MKKRLYKFDNIKAILIFCVVFGHLLELRTGYEELYLFIYSFHMPLFIFITGYFASFNRKKLLSNIVCPYIIFQILYTYFDILVLNNTKLSLTFSKPVWLLWYLFVIFVYYLLLPIISVKENKHKIAILTISIILSLLSGFDNGMGYSFSASRFFVFLPYFVGGYYMAQQKGLMSQILRFGKSQKYGFGLLAAVIYVTLVIYILKQGLLTKQMLYGSYSYEAADYNVLIRLLIMIMAIGFIILFVCLMPDKRVVLYTDIGKYTMPVFLIHGFLVKLIGKYFREAGEAPGLEVLLVLSICIVVGLANSIVNKVFTRMFCWGKVKN